MLYQILAALQQGRTTLSLGDLSWRLVIEPAVLEGMLRTLVAQGRVIALADDGSGCRTCPLHAPCRECARGATGYMLAEVRRCA